MSLSNLFAASDNTTYTKRVMILVTKRMLNPKRGGGVSTFVRGLAKAYPEDTLVEIHAIGADTLEVYEIDKPNIVTIAYPQTTKMKAEEPGLFQRIMINFDQIEEFRHALNKSVFANEKIFDAIVTTCPESALACISYGALIEPFNVVYTTHHGLMSDSLSKVPFDPAVIYFANEVIPKSGFVTTVTQTPKNAEWLLEKHGVIVDHVIPLLPDEIVYESGDRSHKEGALFIGKFETGKRPDWFITMLKRTGIKGKILCGGVKATKAWEKALAAEGITNYEIGHNLQGKAKEDFISSARFTFISSMNESYGYLALEGLANGPTMIVESRWAEFWAGYGATIFGRTGRFETAKALHEQMEWDPTPVKKMVEEAHVKWMEVTIGTKKNFKVASTSPVLKHASTEYSSINEIFIRYDVRSLASQDYKAINEHCEIIHMKNKSMARLVNANP